MSKYHLVIVLHVKIYDWSWSHQRQRIEPTNRMVGPCIGFYVPKAPRVLAGDWKKSVELARIGALDALTLHSVPAGHRPGSLNELCCLKHQADGNFSFAVTEIQWMYTHRLRTFRAPVTALYVWTPFFWQILSTSDRARNDGVLCKFPRA